MMKMRRPKLPVKPVEKTYAFYMFSKPFGAGDAVSWNYIKDGDNAPSQTKGTDFGTVDDGEGRQTIFIADNQGDATVTFTGTPKVRVLANGAGFSASVHGLPSELKPHTGQRYSVTFYPKQPGEVIATVTVPYRVTEDKEYTFVVRGFGLFGKIEVLGNSFVVEDGEANPNLHKNTDFGNVPVKSSRTVEFEIRNSGEGSLHMRDVVVNGTHAKEFTFASHPGQSIKPGRTTRFGITFTPKTAGIRTAAVNLTTSDPTNGLFLFAIQGTGQSKTKKISSRRGSRVRPPPGRGKRSAS